ncbi:MAG: alanine--tRNA ligase [Phycisphaerae bacterium]
MKTADQIRSEFIEFFVRHGHTAVPSSPVVPHDDPTLLFTNAGMNQFKDVFLGTGSRPYSRAVDTQKCIRAGGKHNDLDDVGHDTYHHTFFEMLGNWSFGDYFKREAIAWAWELLTKVWGIDKRRLHATYFQGDEHEGLEPDLEARDLWASVTDIDPAHIHPGSKKDNFWEMGDTGPCGPCSEIHIDQTPDRSGGRLVNAGDPRVMEIWNLVFIQYNRASDGRLTPLPAKHVDTGMGFERITAVLQGMQTGRLGQVSNYDTDVFSPIFAGIRRVTGAPAYTGLLEAGPGNEATKRRSEAGSVSRADSVRTAVPASAPQSAPGSPQLMVDIAYRVVADHIRCLTFALTDGAVPGNEGRGYVLRRILRRAVRYGRQYLNVREPFLCKLVPVVVEAMGHAFPELRAKPDRVAELIREEEESFIRTLDRGIALFDEAADRAKQAGRIVISGDDAFRLHDTYGFPIDLTEIMARERGMTVDTREYERLMEEAREKAKGTKLTQVDDEKETLAERNLRDAAAQKQPPTDDEAKYAEELTCKARIVAGAWNGEGPAKAGETVVLTLDRTCMYAEQGGQVSDIGVIDTGRAEIEVTQLQRRTASVDGIPRAFVLHIGKVTRGMFAGEPECTVRVPWPRRKRIMQNHTATHILNWALREVLEIGGGGKVDQKGSLVDPEKTRFDFSHNKPLTPEEIERIVALCNEKIRADLPVHTKVVKQADALKINTLRAVFGEKYPDEVRVVSCGADIDAMLRDPKNPEWMKYPVEFCGGTHVKRTGEIGSFVLVSEEAVAKGIRRVVGITGEKAQKAVETGRRLCEKAASIKAGPADGVAAGLAELQKEMLDAEIPLRDRIALRDAVAELQQIARKQSKQVSAESAGALRAVRQQLLDAAERINGHALIVGEVPSAPVEQIREAADWLRTQAGSAAVLLGMRAEGDKPLLLAAVTEDLKKTGLHAGNLIREIAVHIDGRGGGKPDMAQAGGRNAEGLAAALKAGAEVLRKQLG